MTPRYPLPINQASDFDHASRARYLFNAAGDTDEPETRALLRNQAHVHLSAANSRRAVTHV